MMMQTAKFRRLDDFTVSDRLYASWFRGIFAQRQVSSPMMVQLVNTKPIMRKRVKFNIHGTRGSAGRYGYTEHSSDTPGPQHNAD
jgi:hypothetical protein